MTENKKGRLSALFDNKTFVMILSLVLAIVLWIVVVFGISPDTEQTIRGVTVNLTTNNASFQNLGLDIADRGEVKVDVKIYGPRAIVGALTADRIIVEPNYSRVDSAGSYTLELVPSKVNTLDDFQILSVEPSTIDLRFDVSTSRYFTVEAEGVGVTAADGYVVEPITVTPSSVRITGPENDMALIERAVARYDVGSDELTETVTISDCPIVLYDTDGNELPLNTFTIDYPQVDIRIPVYKLGMLPLKIEFTNVPEGFDVSTLEYVMSVDEIEVSGPENVIDSLTEHVVGYIDLTTFKIGDEYTFNIELRSSLINKGPQTVTVTFPRENIGSKRISVTNIQVTNVPSNYDIVIKTTRINDVTIIGQADDVAALLPGSVVAVVDFSDLNVESGSYSVPVTFTITANNTTWVAGSYTVYVEVVPK